MKKNRHLLGIVYGCILICFTVYVLLDTFVIPREYVQVEKEDKDDDKTSGNNKNPNDNSFTDQVIITDNSYSDKNISITITEYREYDTAIYVADVILSSPEYLQTAFARNGNKQ